MNAKRKVTYTFYTDAEDPAKIEQLATSRKIRVAALEAGQNMAQWARALGMSRQYIYQVVSGKRRNQRVRDFIETRLNTIFWPKTDDRKDAGSQAS